MKRVFAASTSAFLFTLLGCGEPQERFAAGMADAICDRMRVCDKGRYLDSYFGHGDCRSSQEADLLALIDERAAQGCDFDEEEALDAESDVRDMDCESFYEAVYVDARLVESVWTDCAEEGEE